MGLQQMDWQELQHLVLLKQLAIGLEALATTFKVSLTSAQIMPFVDSSSAIVLHTFITASSSVGIMQTIAIAMDLLIKHQSQGSRFDYTNAVSFPR